MKIEELPSGSYRIRKTYKKKTYTLILDHKPTDKEALILMAEYMQNVSDKGKTAALMVCVDNYIKNRSNVLSPSTIKGYRQVSGMFPDWIMKMNVYDIDQDDIQRAVNDYASDHSPKSVKNFQSLLKSSIQLYRPNFHIKTTLPAKKESDSVLPSEDDIRNIVELAKGSRYYIPILLGCCGLRRSEICALSINDLEGDAIIINKTMVLNERNKYVIRQNTKTSASTRTVFVGKMIADAIREQGYIYEGYPNNIVRGLHRFQDQLGIERFRFHDLRHFYCSFCHSKGMSEADILANGGWVGNSDVMRKVYRHAMKKDEENQRVLTELFG